MKNGEIMTCICKILLHFDFTCAPEHYICCAQIVNFGALGIHYFCQIPFSTKSKTFNVIFFHESFNVLYIFRVKTVFYSSKGFFLKIVKLLKLHIDGEYIV